MASPHPVLVDLAAGRRPPTTVATAEGSAIVRGAVEHRVDGLLHTAVSTGLVVLPDEDATELARLDVLRRLQVRRARAALVEATTRLRDAGFESATFKGVTAGDRWYRRPGERPAGDVDLWLAPRDGGRLREAVAALDPRHAFVTAGTDRAVRAINVEVAGVWVDLHRVAVLPHLPTAFDDAMWERTTTVVVDEGVTVRVADPAGALVQLLVHLNKHHFADLLWFADVARLLAVDAPDETDVRGLARTGGLSTVVTRSLALVRGALDLPPAVDAGRTRATNPTWRDRIWLGAWPPSSVLRGSDVDEAGTARQRLAMPLVVRNGVGAAAASLADVLFPAAHLVDLEYGEGGGSYLRRLAGGRVRRWRARRARRAG